MAMMRQYPAGRSLLIVDADALRALHDTVDEEIRRKWARSLSFQDGLFDRWERARRLGFGDGSSIYNSTMILEPVTVGEDVWIGPGCLLDGSGGGLTISDGVDVSAGVHIYTHDTVLACLSGKAIPRREGPVSIGARTYLGPQTVIVAGVTIGEMCVVGAGSFVNADVPDRTVVAGTPARVVGRVEGDGANVRIVHDSSPVTFGS